MSREADLDRLLAVEAIRELSCRYARTADRRDYATFREIFTEDGAIRVFRGDPETTEPYIVLEGRDAIATGMEGLEAWAKTQHQVANQLVEVDGDRATAETYCTAHHVTVGEGEPSNLTMAIRYQDRLVRREGRWWFEQRHLAVDWERVKGLGAGGWA